MTDQATLDAADIAFRYWSAPVNGTIEFAGPERFRFDELIQRVLEANGDARRVAADDRARYFGAELEEGSLVPGDDADDAVWAGPAELDTLPLTEGLLDTLRSWGVV